MPTKHKPKKTKISRAAQTRAIALDRAKRPASTPSPEQIEQRLADLVKPVVLNLQQHYYAAGLRVRILTLPVMVCFILSLSWRQLASVNTALRELCQFGLLWQPPLKVSQQAVSQRLRALPAQLFEQLLAQLLPLFQSRWHSRTTPRPAWQAKL
jgi:hypothetical protein